MHKSCNTHSLLWFQYINHDKNSKVSPFTNDVALHVDNENGCLPIQEIGIEIFNKTKPTHTTFPCPWTKFQKDLSPNGLKSPHL